MKNKILYYAIIIDLFLFIVGGNVLSFVISGTRFRLSEILSIFIGVVLIFKLKIDKDKSLLIIFLWSILSLILIIVNVFVYKFGFSAMLKAIMYLIRFVFGILSAFLFAKYVKSIGKKNDLLKFINLFYVIACVIGFFQYLFFPTALEWYSLFDKIGVNWVGDPHESRLVTTDFDPNFFSSCLLIGVSVNAYLLKTRFLQDKTIFEYAKIKYYCIFIIYFIALILTKSRSGIIGLFVILLLTYLSYLNFKKLNINYLVFGIVAVNIFTALLAFSNFAVFPRLRNILDPSVGARFSSWAKSFSVIKDTYFLGIGYNLFPAYNTTILGVAQSNSSSGVDSSLLFILITTGIIGFALMIFHYVFLLKGKSREFVILFIASVVVCNFNNLLFYSMWVFPFYFCVFVDDGRESDKQPVERKEKQQIIEIKSINSKFDVSVIVINYNAYELTKHALESLFDFTQDINFEVILIDNNSPDGSGILLKKEFGDKIIYIQAEENLGTSKAFNRALKYANGKYVLWLNPDVIFIENFIKKLYNFMETHSNCGVCGGNLVDGNGKPVHSFRKNQISIETLKKDKSLIIYFFRKIFSRFLSEEYNYSALPKEVGYITGADMFVRRDILISLGGFDEDIFMYAEETEFQFRVKKFTDYKIYSVPSATLIHLEGKSFSGEKFNPQRHRLNVCGTAVYLTKSYGKDYALKYFNLLEKSYKKFYALCYFWDEKRIMYKTKLNTLNDIKQSYLEKTL